MELCYEARSHRGLVRTHNEDAVLVCGKLLSADKEAVLVCGKQISGADGGGLLAASGKADGGVFAVCDGMGGERFGGEAAAIAVSSLAGIAPRALPLQAGAAIDRANAAICRLMEERGARIGTTLAALSVCDGGCWCANLGDSRVYHRRGETLRRLSADHTRAAQMIGAGILSPEEAARHPARHQLTQHLGIFPEEFTLEPHTAEAALLPGDDLLLCSDGLTDGVSDAAIAGCLLRERLPRQAADGLLSLALAAGGRDNISLILLRF